MKTAAGFATTAGACVLVSMTVVAPTSADPAATTASQPAPEGHAADVRDDAAMDAWFALRWGKGADDDDPEAESSAAPAQSRPAVSRGSAPRLVRAEARR
jgi:hypothetical protein